MLAATTAVRRASAAGCRRAGLALLLSVAGGAAWSQPSPIGLWRTIDDATGEPKSLVRIVERDGVVEGRLEKILDPARAELTCVSCDDERRGQPLQGMTLLRNVRAEGDGRWGGGDILDPQSGKVYHVRLEPTDDGRQLKVRGYIGLPAFGRSQTWQRVE